MKQLIPFLIFFALSTASAQDMSAAHEPVSGTISIAPESGSHIKDIHIATEELEPEEAAQEIAAQVAASPDTTIFSSDEPDLLSVGAEAGEKLNQGQEASFLLLPVGKALRNYRENVGHALRHDTIGLMVVSFSIGAETIRWIHTAHMSGFVQGANIGYSVLIALAFAVDKSNWARAVRPIQKVFRKTLRMSSEIPTHLGWRDYGVGLLSNFVLTGAVNLGRVPILSFDKLMHHTLAVTGLPTTVLMSLVTATTGFAWTEMVASISQKKNPRAKFFANRALDGRNLIIGAWASSAMLLNFSAHGFYPWITLTVIGVTGVPVFYNRVKLANMIETNPTLDRLIRAIEPARDGVRSALESAGQFCRAAMLGFQPR